MFWLWSEPVLKQLKIAYDCLGLGLDRSQNIQTQVKSGCNEQGLDCNFPIFLLFTSSHLPRMVNWLDGFNKRVSAIVCVLHRVFLAPKEVSGTLLLISDS